MPEKGHKLDMVPALLEKLLSMEARGRFHGRLAQGWKRLLGFGAFCSSSSAPPCATSTQHPPPPPSPKPDPKPDPKPQLLGWCTALQAQ